MREKVMTENEIEKIYERTMDKLDHELMNALIAEDEYDQQVAELDKWVDEMYREARLIEENDVLRYQYEAMKNETMRCKEQIDQLQKTIADK